MKWIQSKIGRQYYKAGLAKGTIRAQRETALRMIQQYGFSIKDAAAINEMDEKELRAWLKRKGLATQPV